MSKKIPATAMSRHKACVVCVWECARLYVWACVSEVCPFKHVAPLSSLGANVFGATSRAWPERKGLVHYYFWLHFAFNGLLSLAAMTTSEVITHFGVLNLQPDMKCLIVQATQIRLPTLRPAWMRLLFLFFFCATSFAPFHYAAKNAVEKVQVGNFIRKLEPCQTLSLSCARLRCRCWCLCAGPAAAVEF